MSKLQFLIKKRVKKNFRCTFFNDWSSKPWIRIRNQIRIQLKAGSGSGFNESGSATLGLAFIIFLLISQIAAIIGNITTQY